MRTTTRAMFTVAGLAVALALVGCRAQSPVPAQPTWVDDIEPILRGNCMHCHGSEAGRLAEGNHLDIYDPGDPGFIGLDLLGTGIFNGAKVLAPSMVTRIRDTKRRMPPQPAPGLSERDKQVVERWAQNPIRGTRVGNHPPQVVLTGTRAHDGKLDVSLLITDGDLDQVLGLVSYGAVGKTLIRTGAHVVTFDDAGLQALSARLSDGQDVVTLPLGMVGTSGVMGGGDAGTSDGGTSDTGPSDAGPSDTRASDTGG